MSLAPGHAALRARIAEAISGTLDDTAHRALGRELGVAGHTITARGSDPAAWPLDDALRLAIGRADLTSAIVGFLQGADVQPQAEPIAAIPGGIEAAERLGVALASILGAVKDRRITRDEFADIASSWHEVLALMPAFLRDAKALSEGVRR